MGGWWSGGKRYSLEFSSDIGWLLADWGATCVNVSMLAGKPIPVDMPTQLSDDVSVYAHELWPASALTALWSPVLHHLQ